MRPNLKKLGRIVDILRGGGLVIYPTDSTYSLGCDVYMRRSVDRVYQLKGMTRGQALSFLCDDLAQVARYANLSNENFRIIRKSTPGPFTFLLPATKEVPRALQSKRKVVGVRIPTDTVCQALVSHLGHPLLSTTVIDRDAGQPLHVPDEIDQGYGRSIEGFVDVGELYGQPSTVIDLSGDEPVLVRAGAGDVSQIFGSD